MGELLAVTCDSCGEPMVPNVSTLDDDGCGWICLNPGGPELAAGELEAEDLAEAGVPEVVYLPDTVATSLPSLVAFPGMALCELIPREDFAEAQDARRALAVAAALCAYIRRTAGDAQDRLSAASVPSCPDCSP